MQKDINHDGRDPSSKHVDGVMGLDIYRCQTHQYEERHHTPEKLAVMSSPSQKHEYRCYSHMTTWEGCCRALACCMG